MYNRYIPNQQGGHVRIPQEDVLPHSDKPPLVREPPPAPKEETAPQPHSPPSAPKSPSFPSRSGGGIQITDGLTGFLRHALDQFHLDHVDTGDLLLLGLLFFLFREDADEELLIALGLLLIL